MSLKRKREVENSHNLASLKRDLASQNIDNRKIEDQYRVTAQHEVQVSSSLKKIYAFFTFMFLAASVHAALEKNNKIERSYVIASFSLLSAMSAFSLHKNEKSARRASSMLLEQMNKVDAPGNKNVYWGAKRSLGLLYGFDPYASRPKRIRKAAVPVGP